MIIYKITNKINNKCYIGQTVKSLEERKRTHQWGNQLIHKAIKKYGEDSFVWEIIDDTCQSYDELLEMEHHYIMQYKSYCKEWGYNLTMGGDGAYGRECSVDTREKISQSNRGRRPWNKGLTKDTDDRLKEVSDNRKGYKCSDHIKKVMSDSAKRRCDECHINRFINRMKDEDVVNKRSSTIKNNGSFKNSNNPRWNKNLDESRLVELYGTMNKSRLSEVLGVPLTTLCRRIKKLQERGIL